jgi:hypothetical protein
MNKFLLALALALTLASFVPTSICNADSGPPPAIIIVVTNAPQDLTISIGTQTSLREDKPFASYYIFNQYNLNWNGLGLQVVSADKHFNVPLNNNMRYRNYFTLDLETQTLTSVDSLPGTEIVPFLMITLTLLIEGIVFFIFGYRQKRSWLIFLGVNLVTQIGLINWLSQTISFTDAYAVLDLFVGEVLVFIIELIAFGILLREYGPLRRISYVFLANFLSLFLGGYILSRFTI